MLRREFLKLVPAAAALAVSACIPEIAPASTGYERIAQYHNVEHWMTPRGDIWISRFGLEDHSDKMAAVEAVEEYVYGRTP